MSTRTPSSGETHTDFETDIVQELSDIEEHAISDLEPTSTNPVTGTESYSLEEVAEEAYRSEELNYDSVDEAVKGLRRMSPTGRYRSGTRISGIDREAEGYGDLVLK